MWVQASRGPSILFLAQEEDKRMGVIVPFVVASPAWLVGDISTGSDTATAPVPAQGRAQARARPIPSSSTGRTAERPPAVPWEERKLVFLAGECAGDARAQLPLAIASYCSLWPAGGIHSVRKTLPAAPMLPR